MKYDQSERQQVCGHCPGWHPCGHFRANKVQGSSHQHSGSQGTKTVQFLCNSISFVDNFPPQTDRPSSQFWNSGMLRGHRRLAVKHRVTIRHITEQSMHNKVG